MIGVRGYKNRIFHVVSLSEEIIENNFINKLIFNIELAKRQIYEKIAFFLKVRLKICMCVCNEERRMRCEIVFVHLV